MARRDPLNRKLSDLRYNHGPAAAKYFEENPSCEVCPEDKIVCLAVHHVRGKEYEDFQTLCFNCHALVHSHRTGSYIVRNYREAIKAQLELELV